MRLRLPTPPQTPYDAVWIQIVHNKSMFANPENAFMTQPETISRNSMLGETYDSAQKTDSGILFCSKTSATNTLNLEVFHHIKRSSSPLATLKKDDKFYGVLSLHNKVVSLPLPTATNVCSKVAVPCDADILGISSKEDFDSATPQAKSPTKITVLPCIGIPPECILEVSKHADSKHTYEIFMILKDYYQSQVLPFAELFDEPTKAGIVSVFIRVLQSIWAFRYSDDMSLPDHDDIVSSRAPHPDPLWWNTFYAQSATKVTSRVSDSSTEALDSLAQNQSRLASLSENQQALFSKLLDFQNSAASSVSKTSWKHRILHPIHPALFRMQAPSPYVSDDSLPSSPTENYVSFLEASDMHRTQCLLQFCRMKNLHVNISKRCLTNLSVAQLIGCDTNGAPSFTVFQFFPPNNMPNSVAQVSITEEQLRQHHGYTAAHIESLCGKEAFSIPVSDGQLLSQVKNFCGIIGFISGENSYFHCMCRKNLSDYLGQHLVQIGLLQSLDNRFFGKLLAYIDACVQAFLTSVFDASSVSNVNFDALLFPLIRSHVENLGSKISSDVPPAVARDAFSASKRSLKHMEQEKDSDRTNKKRKTDNSSGDTNENPNTEWLVDKKQFFAFNKRLRSCPKLNGKEICCKFHVLGHCPLGKDCTRSGSHGPLTGEAEASFASWCKEVKDAL